jgi:glycerol-3-phosphate dehydrogenase
LRRLEPAFLPEEACGAYAYSDCVMDDARLVIENLADAAALGAKISNYRSFQALEPAGDGLLEVTILDRLSGRETVHRAKQVAIAAGPWTDQVVSAAFPGAAPQVRLSQGIHLIAAGIPSQACFILPVPGSKRYFFMVPWKGKHLIGTTETELDGPPPAVPVPREDEVAELLRLARIYFPAWEPDVICTLTGIRPLARGGKGSTVTLSREHEFHTLRENVFSAVGGKYTTHRSFAEAFLRHIAGSKRELKDIKGRPLPGAWKDIRERDAIRRGLMAYPFADETVAAAWLRRYGKRALEVAEFVSGDAARRERLPGPYGLLLGELMWSAEKEWAKTPEDFLRRRTDAYFARGGGTECLDRVTAFFAARTPGLAALGTEADYAAFLRANRHVAAGAAGKQP